MESLLPPQLAAAVAFLRLDLLGELLLAVLVGGLIGLEREASGKPAGLRTNILICLGATLITDVSLGLGDLGTSRADSARLAAQIVSGIGFLGAGTIMQARGTVTGLTSAATLWVVAAIGIAIGSRHTVEAIGAAFLVLLILFPLGEVERRLSAARRVHTLTVTVERRPEAVAALAADLAGWGLTVRGESVEVEGDALVIRFDVVGAAEPWQRAKDGLLARSDLRAMRMS